MLLILPHSCAGKLDGEWTIVAEKAHPPVSDENRPYQGIAAPLKTLMGGEVFSGGPGCPSSLSRVGVEQAMHGQPPRRHPDEAPLQIMLICFRMDR